jgi:uncharacterized protein (TIGR03067 family)
MEDCNMKSLFGCSLLVCLCVGSFALGDDRATAKGDSKKINGTWKPVKAQLAGKPYPDKILKSMKVVVKDGKYTVTAGDETDEGTVKLDLSKKPWAMDLKSRKGPFRNKTILAIYEFTDGGMRVCYDMSGKARPREFKSTAGSLLFLVEYRRQAR